MSTPAPTSDGLAVQPNAFQRLMIQWEQLAPYNAAQYATLTTDVSDDFAAQTWRDVVITLGLQQIGQTPDAAVDISHGSIEARVNEDLNRDFASGDPPLRPFVHRDERGTSVGIFYRHAVADSASIRLVARAWIERLLRLPIGVPRTHIATLRDGEFRLFDARRSWNVLRESIADFSRLSRTKRVRRLRATADITSAVRWRRVDLPAGFLGRLIALARRERVRLNDLFVASAALACDEFMPHEEIEMRRDLGVGTIADVRPTDRPPHLHFGLMLGFLQTFWRWQDLGTWQRTLAVAAAQSSVARERCLADASLVRLLMAQRLGRGKSVEELTNFYRKRCPLAAGISNVNLNLGWPAALHPSPVAAYTRVSPLGPMLPLVFTPTTLGDTLHLGVTYRVSVLSTAAVNAVIAAFIERLDRESRASR